VTAPDTTGPDTKGSDTKGPGTATAGPGTARPAVLGPEPAASRAGPGTVPASGRTGLADICAVLWPPPASASLARGRAARPGERDFILLPRAQRPRLLVPASRRASAAAVRRYGEPGSLRAWAASRALALALAGGGAALGVGGRLRVQAAPGGDSIEAYLSDALGHEVLISTHLGAARANRKPVLQLLTDRGETAGFAKISINPLTRDLILAERAALTQLAAGTFRGLTVPRILHHGQWREREVLIMSALPVWRWRKPLGAERLAAAMMEIADVGGRDRGSLAGSPYLARLRARVAALPAGPDRDALGAALEVLAGTDVELSFGFWHGDWTGWNMASTADGLLVWDWERFTPGVPVGFDALHYRLQLAVVRRQQPPSRAAAECVRAAPSSLAALSVPAVEARVVAILYLAELSARYLADRQAEAGAKFGRPGTWLIPAIKEAVSIS
jgi:hypothetical protein